MRFTTKTWKRSSYLIANTDFELETIGDVSGTWDRERLGQVVFNLVVNAVIHASAKHVHITAEDQGPDVVLRSHEPKVYRIPAERQDSIFDPFVSTDTPSSSAPTKTGLGLGLFIVREIVNGHAGTVEVASTESEGTTFTVRLPRVLQPTHRQGLQRPERLQFARSTVAQRNEAVLG